MWLHKLLVDAQIINLRYATISARFASLHYAFLGILRGFVVLT